jgi:hypothetical protein
MKRFLTSLLLPGLIGCTEAQASPPKGPVVLELFTSEGCSSCPPADALLAEVGALPNVIALELHVDYWDDLGWKDPFSKEQFSARQGVYSASLDRIGVYTPQIVANGIAQGVGSNRSRVADLLATVPPATAPVTLAARREGGSVVVSATAPGAPAGAELLVALAESGLETQVLRGENTGRHLVHTGVVRVLEKVPASGEIKLPLDETKGGQLAVVALLQDKKTRRILGAAKTSL